MILPRLRQGFDSPYPLMLISLFAKITRQRNLERKIARKDNGVYLHLLFPISVAFLLTFVIARLISHIDPTFYIQVVEDLHIHHYAYGIFILAIAGYLALANSSPRDRYLISLLYGFGLGLVFDEFGFWLHLTDETAARFSYDGVLILAALFLLLISSETGMNMWQAHFSRKRHVRNDPVLAASKEFFEPFPGV